MRHDSPLRYPGGKASLAGLLAETIKLNGLEGCPYYEPFAGGAGAALRLLREETVSEVHLNDLDPAIAAFWGAVLDQPERFAETIMSVALNIKEWKRQQGIYQKGNDSVVVDPFDYGFATFYLNRCNRSGVLSGAGPIGGYDQAGKWKMDARFNRENLAKRVLEIGKKRDQIWITCMDAYEFLKSNIPKGRSKSKIFVYLDPPYFLNSHRLYLNSFSENDHRNLAAYIKSQKDLHCLISYDDTEFIIYLYADFFIHRVPLRYSLQKKIASTELLITSIDLKIQDLSNDSCGKQRIVV